MKIKIFIIIATVIFTAGLNANILPDSVIDWSSGKIKARGMAYIIFNDKGLPLDPVTGDEIPLSKARMNSYIESREKSILNLFNAIKRMRLDADSSIEDMLRTNNTARLRIAGLSEKISYRDFPSGFGASVCEAELNFGILMTLIPDEFPSIDFPVREYIPVSTPYSGLIIDARELEIEPMLFPSVFDDTGKEIYGKYYVDGKYASKNALAAYCYTTEEAVKNSRSGQNPYYAVAVKSLKNCPVLSSKDSGKILGNSITISNLKECKVVFILNKKNKQVF